MRNIPLYSYDVEDFEVDLKNIQDIALVPDTSDADFPQQEQNLSLEQRLAFLKLPLVERRKILESQAETMLAHRQQGLEL